MRCTRESRWLPGRLSAAELGSGVINTSEQFRGTARVCDASRFPAQARYLLRLEHRYPLGQLLSPVARSINSGLDQLLHSDFIDAPIDVDQCKVRAVDC